MRGIVLVAAMIFAVPVREHIPPSEPPQPLHEQLQGLWQMIQAQSGGKSERQEKIDQTTMVFKGTQIQILEQGKPTPEDAMFTLDGSKSPIAIDIVPERARNDVKVAGIIKIEGELLTLCFAKGGRGARPTEFVSAPDSGVVVLQFKRIKK